MGSESALFRQLRQAMPLDQRINSKGTLLSIDNPERNPFMKTNPEASLDSLASEALAFINAPDNSPMGMFLNETPDMLAMADNGALRKVYRMLTTKGLQDVKRL